MEEELFRLIELNDEKKLTEYLNKNCELIDWKKVIIDETKPINGCSYYILGLKYRTGLGIEKNHQKGLHYYILSAKQNNVYAQNNLGNLYQYGLGVERDYKKAIYYHQLAANKGNYDSHINLATICIDGLNIEKDYEKCINHLLSIDMEYLRSNKCDDFFFSKEYLNDTKTFVLHILQKLQEFKEKNKNLEIKNSRLNEENKKLKDELDCIPEYGKGYFNARKHFEDHK